MQFAESQAEFLDAMQQFLKGEMSAGDLKHASAPLGIYQQRNDLFMTRVRITGGHLTVRDARTVAGIIADNGIGYAHLTTRQDIQLQDVPAEQVGNVVQTSTEQGLPFRGGGGNTFRNILVSATSGIGPDSVFDVLPYAKALTDVFFGWDLAYVLPRKIKIGFFDSPQDELSAAVQDLGFLAKVVDGVSGFKVYGGGGMGRESTTGMVLFDFLPADQVVRCARAMTELFSDHGNRENRNQARIRFIVKRMGKPAFLELFQKYFAEIDSKGESTPAWQLDLDQEIAALSAPATDSPACQEWMARAVQATRFGDGIVSVRLFVPGGNLTGPQLASLAGVAERCGSSFLRLTPTQDVLLPLVRRDSLGAVYALLKDAFPETDVFLESFQGHVTTCIGSTVCKIGILDSPAVGRAIAERLDQVFRDDPELGPEKATAALDAIRISGCPNTCGGHVAARIGLEGQKKKLDGVMEPVYRAFTRANAGVGLAELEADCVLEQDVPDKVCQLVSAMLAK